MGGGRSTASAMYGIYRKQQISEKMIEKTMKAYGVPLDVGYIKVRVVKEKDWHKVGGSDDAAGFYRSGILFIRRKYFAGRKTKVMIHEILHGQSGPRRYEGVGAVLEEGTVEYITQGTIYFGVRGRSADYTLHHYRTYTKEVKVVSQLMQVVGRKKFLRYWKEGFGVTPGGYPHEAGHVKLGRDLHKRGFTRTASTIWHDYYRQDKIEREEMTKRLEEDIRQDIQSNNLPVTLGIGPMERVKEFKRSWKYGEDYDINS